ncbi:hypothetical protein I350_00107 [Cryptococcus amylolentus CBS 6273]|uniref:Uncharacterized protein n=1 Tax=Cryptococcus amylolentus CBS 6273 TaxID=1296118 RepID=A0A1E3KE15_9TREE|nr:hypothetical protein I350_00107 [Cryptococcus amylolentus CBS 6273]
MITDNNHSNNADVDGFEVVPQNVDQAAATLNIAIDAQTEAVATDAIVEQTEKLSIATPEPTAEEKQDVPHPRGHGRHPHGHHGPRGHMRPPPGFSPAEFDVEKPARFEDGETHRPRPEGHGRRHHRHHGPPPHFFESDGEKPPHPEDTGDKSDRSDRPRPRHPRHHHHPRGGMPPPGFAPFDFDSDRRSPPPPPPHPGMFRPPPGFDFEGFPSEFFGRGERHGRRHHERRERGMRGEPGMESAPGSEIPRGHKHRHHRAHSPDADESKSDFGPARRHHHRGFGPRGPHCGPGHHGPRPPHPRHPKSDNEEVTEKKPLSDGNTTSGSESETSSSESESGEHCCCSHRPRGGPRHGPGFGRPPPHMMGMGMGMYGPPPPHMFFDDFRHSSRRGMRPPSPPPHFSFTDKYDRPRRVMPTPPPFGEHFEMMGGREHRGPRHAGFGFGGRGSRGDDEYRPRPHPQEFGFGPQGSDDEYRRPSRRGMPPPPPPFGFKQGFGGRGDERMRGMPPPPPFESDFINRGMSARGPFFSHMGMPTPPHGPRHHRRPSSPLRWMNDYSDSDYDDYPSSGHDVRDRRHHHHGDPRADRGFYARGPAFFVRA